MLLNLGQFGLVALLGFLPLIIVHWADRHPKLRLPRAPRAALQAVIAFKASVLVGLTNWLMSVGM